MLAPHLNIIFGNLKLTFNFKYTDSRHDEFTGLIYTYIYIYIYNMGITKQVNK